MKWVEVHCTPMNTLTGYRGFAGALLSLAAATPTIMTGRTSVISWKSKNGSLLITKCLNRAEAR